MTPGLGRPSREGNVNLSSTLAWKIPRTEEDGRLQSVGSQRVDTTERLHFHFHFTEVEIHFATDIFLNGLFV